MIVKNLKYKLGDYVRLKNGNIAQIIDVYPSLSLFDYISRKYIIDEQNIEDYASEEEILVYRIING